MNFDLPLEIIQGYKDVVENLQILDEQICKYPHGWIEQKKENGTVYFYHRYLDESGKKHSEKIDDLDRMQLMIDIRNALCVQRRYYKKIRKKYEKTLKYFQIDCSILEQEVQRQREEAEEAESKYFEELKKAQKKSYSDKYRYVTLTGVRVLSKSEMMIADALTRRGIEYKYEQPITIHGFTLRPDFTFTYRNKTYYWEHLGLLNKADYREDWEWKRRLYKEQGIEEGINLIISRESEGHPFTQGMIDGIMVSYLGI